MQIRNGRITNLPYHNARMHKARSQILDCQDAIRIENVITIPAGFETGRGKCRIIYGKTIESIEFREYQVRQIASLKIVDAEIEYSHKYEDRSEIKALFGQRMECDDILITKEGRITDTSISNVAFRDGAEWFTPIHPLLPGTRRMQLLNEGRIKARDIFIDDLQNFQEVCLINAMLDLGEMIIPVQQIK
jgi:4-amino-4-deoxychorismate lyase